MKIKMMMLTLMIFLIMPLSGCWNYREISDMGIVAGAAIDKDPHTGKYLVTVEVVNPSQQQQETQISSGYFEMEGDTMFGAVRNLIELTGRKLYWGHAKLMIISEEIAKTDMLSVLDFLTRDAEVRNEVWLVIAHGKTAKEILHSQIKLGNLLSIHLEKVFYAQQNINKFAAVRLYEFIKDLADEGISATAATASIRSAKAGSYPRVYGTAVFKEDKLVGWFNGDQTIGMKWLKNEIETGGQFEETVKINGKDTKLTLEIYRNKTKVQPLYSADGELTMKVEVLSSIIISQVSRPIDLGDPAVKQQIISATEAQIKKQLQQALNQAQQYQSDVFGFGRTVKLQMPWLWKKIGANWSEIFTDLTTQIDVKVNIEDSGLIYKGIKVGN